MISEIWSSSDLHKITALSIVFESSLTFPGQLYSESFLITLSFTSNSLFRFISLQNFFKKNLVKRFISPFLSLNGGRFTGNTQILKNRSFLNLFSETAVSRLVFVAKTNLISRLISCELPILEIDFSSITLKSFPCRCRGKSPISSRKTLPPSASSKSPILFEIAPVKAHLTCPKS